MNTRFPFVTRPLLALVLAAWGIAANSGSYAADTTNAPNKLDYAAFSMVPERNIFNPNRVPRMIQTERREPRRQPRTETLTFVGTMQYDKGYVAFFDGSDSQYKKAVRPSESIAGFKLAEVTHNQVKLSADTNQLTLQMGMQMRKEEEGSWMLAGRSDTVGSRSSYEGARSSVMASPFDRTFSRDSFRTDRGSGWGRDRGRSNSDEREVQQPAAAVAAPVSASPPATDASNEDIIQRLMKRREQEMNK